MLPAEDAAPNATSRNYIIVDDIFSDCVFLGYEYSLEPNTGCPDYSVSRRQQVGARVRDPEGVSGQPVIPNEFYYDFYLDFSADAPTDPAVLFYYGQNDYYSEFFQVDGDPDSMFSRSASAPSPFGPHTITTRQASAPFGSPSTAIPVSRSEDYSYIDEVYDGDVLHRQPTSADVWESDFGVDGRLSVLSLEHGHPWLLGMQRVRTVFSLHMSRINLSL